MSKTVLKNLGQLELKPLQWVTVGQTGQVHEVKLGLYHRGQSLVSPLPRGKNPNANALTFSDRVKILVNC